MGKHQRIRYVRIAYSFCFWLSKFSGCFISLYRYLSSKTHLDVHCTPILSCEHYIYLKAIVEQFLCTIMMTLTRLWRHNTAMTSQTRLCRHKHDKLAPRPKLWILTCERCVDTLSMFTRCSLAIYWRFLGKIVNL